MTERSWKSIDEIIEALAEPPPEPKTVVPTTCPMSDDPVFIYRCEQDSYDIYYAPSLGEATYRFDGGTVIDVDHLTAGHVEYYEKSEYWKRL